MDSLMNRKKVALLSRRALLMSSIAAAAALTGCQLGDDTDDLEATATPEPTPTPELTPTPTQAPIGSPVPGYTEPTRWTGRTLTVASWGGDYEEAQREAFYQPFEKATGATIQLRVADINDLRAQVEGNNVIWDLLTLPMEQVIELGRENLLTAIDYDVVNRTPLFEDILHPFGVGASYFSTVIIYPATTTHAPQGWADFWNAPAMEEGEGVDIDPLIYRSLQRSPIGTLEFALIADGVPTDELYPLDVDRAFVSLDRLRENVIVWWQESKEPIELVSAEQAGMASAWNSRIDQLELGDMVRVQWYDGMLSADAWVVPRGSENTDVAMDFINFATRAIPSANFSRLVPYGPVNRDAFSYLRQNRLGILPSSPTNKPLQFVQDWTYWADNREEVTARFEEWLLTGPELATPEADEGTVE
jgi:putative spermidine/putrescine transport system substrate-binding protein